jgi:3-methyladenine DNA glycosylase/8-oxoguanine DNA glycosylase
MTEPTATRTWPLRRPLDVLTTLGVHRRGGADPTFRVERAARGVAVWRTARTPYGPGTMRCAVQAGDGFGVAVVQAWGPGADWLTDHAPRWLGEDDDLDGFRPIHAVVRNTMLRLRGWRISATGLVLESLVPAILEQKVTGIEARASWRWLLTRYGEPAPGPVPAWMRVVPDTGGWAAIPEWDWHRAGVGPQRATTIRRVARVGPQLSRLDGLSLAEVERRLRAVPGVGAWTAAETLQRACGSADHVSVGDLHIPRLVVHALTGRVTDDDAEMLAVLEPYRPHRYRVQRLVELSGHKAPRFGPRYAPLDHRGR